MPDDTKALTKRPMEVPAEGYGQVVPMAHQILPHKELLSRQLTGTLKRDEHFYCTKEWNKELNRSELIYRPRMEGKMLVAGLADCWYETKVVERQLDYIRAEATVFYRTPTGEVLRFPREKEISIPIERQAAIQRKINSALFGLKSREHGSPEKYAAVTQKFNSFADPGDAQRYLQSELLDLLDIQEINDNMIKMRQTLANLACSKALSSALTLWLKHIGQRVQYKALTDNEQIQVSVINTIEIPKDVAQTLKVLYEDTEEADREETGRIIEQEVADATEPETMETPRGELVSTGTGEILSASLAISEETPEKQSEGGPSRAELIAATQDAMVQIGWGHKEFARWLKANGLRVKIIDYTDGQLADLLQLIRSEMGQKGK